MVNIRGACLETHGCLFRALSTLVYTVYTAHQTTWRLHHVPAWSQNACSSAALAEHRFFASRRRSPAVSSLALLLILRQ